MSSAGIANAPDSSVPVMIALYSAVSSTPWVARGNSTGRDVYTFRILMMHVPPGQPIPPPHQDAGEAARILLTLETVNAQLHSCPSLESTQRFVLEELAQLAGAAVGWMVLLVDGELRLVHSAGTLPVPWAQLYPWCHYVFEHGRPLIENAPRSGGLANLLILPLLHHTRMLGVVGLANRPGGFPEDFLPHAEAVLFPLAFRLAHGPHQADGVGASVPQTDRGSSDTRFAQAFRQMPVGMCLVQAETGTVLAINAAMHGLLGAGYAFTGHTTPLERLFPLPAAQQIRRGITACVYQGESLPVVDLRVPSAGQEDRTLSGTMIPVRANDGRTLEVLAVFHPQQQAIPGQPAPVVATSRPQPSVTSDWQTEASCQRQAIIDRFPFGVLIAEGREPIRLTANREAHELFGGTVTSVLHGYQFSQDAVVQPVTPRLGGCSGLELALLGTRGEEDVRVTSNGKERTLRMLYTPLCDNDGTQWGAMAQVQDVTEIRNLDRAKEEFLCITSHELQSPLTVIKGYTEQLRWAQEHEQAISLEEPLAAIERQVARMRRLIGDLLAISAAEIDRLHIESQDVLLGELLPRVLDDLTMVHGRAVHFSATTDGRICGDPLRIEQVVRNLVENAVKYSPAPTPVQVALTATEHDAVLTVRDQGPGIPPDEIAHVFDPFYRARAARASKPTAGFGLGLALSRQLVEKHGGTIRVESVLGVGSTFIVALPRCVPATEQRS